ncbi:MAG: RimK family alpha-L-glutamate ligase [Candidatus Thorarchaeota archaeon]|nr:RimK family alpha-L-glutamate ligase [Candidatus Thorarchaeota archaeon]
MNKSNDSLKSLRRSFLAVVRKSKIGLFSSDPWSGRMDALKVELIKLGVEPIRVIPWLVSRHGSTRTHQITCEDEDLSSVDAIIVLDLGASDIGAFFNRVGVLSALTEMGVEIVNSVSSILLMRNKAESMRKLISAGLPVPKTLITESIEDAAEFVRSHFPCVLKPITGFGGIGVQLIERDFDLDNIYDYLKFHSQMFGKGAYLLQEFVRSPGFDIRAFVLDNEVIGTMQRHGHDGIITNIHSGGTPRPNDIDVTDIAVQAARSVKGRMVGVDIIPDMSGDLWVLEVNATPGWSGLEKATGSNVAAMVADVISRI